MKKLVSALKLGEDDQNIQWEAAPETEMRTVDAAG